MFYFKIKLVYLRFLMLTLCSTRCYIYSGQKYAKSQHAVPNQLTNFRRGTAVNSGAARRNHKKAMKGSIKSHNVLFYFISPMWVIKLRLFHFFVILPCIPRVIMPTDRGSSVTWIRNL